MPGALHQAPADQAQDTENQRDGGAFQWPHCRCLEDPPVQQQRGPGADAAALRGLVQPPATAVSPQEQDTDAGHEGLVQRAPAFVSQAAI